MYPDVYYLPSWGKLNAQLENGVYEEFLYESDLGKIIYPYIKRKTPINIGGDSYFDSITPYGFGGPCVIACYNDKQELLEDYKKKFEEHCHLNNIIAEYVRFSPWLNNAETFGEMYQLVDNNNTFFIDLTNKDFFEKIFSSKCRNQIRKAIKNNVQVQLSFGKEKLSEFFELYCKMVQKNNVNDYYKFSSAFIEQTLQDMQGNIMVAVAYHQNIAISASLFLYLDDKIHYHLSGNDKNFSSLCGNHLLLNKVAEWACDNGMKQMHLGGEARGESGLNHFKKEFARDGILPFVIGKKIVNKNIYDAIVKELGKKDNGYFPSYRG